MPSRNPHTYPAAVVGEVQQSMPLRWPAQSVGAISGRLAIEVRRASVVACKRVAATAKPARSRPALRSAHGASRPPGRQRETPPQCCADGVVQTVLCRPGCTARVVRLGLLQQPYISAQTGKPMPSNLAARFNRLSKHKKKDSPPSALCSARAAASCVAS